MSNDIKSGLDQAISRAVREDIDRQVDKIVEDAKQRVEQAIRKVVANTTMQIHRFYKVERIGDDLCITVKIDTDSEKQR